MRCGGHGEPAIIALLQRAERVAGMSANLTRTAHAAGPVICPAFDFDEQVVAALPAVMRFDSSVEVTRSRFRVELMFPADEARDRSSGPA